MWTFLTKASCHRCLTSRKGSLRSWEEFSVENMLWVSVVVVFNQRNIHMEIAALDVGLVLIEPSFLGVHAIRVIKAVILCEKLKKAIF